jgi:methyl-accepting chemotaxis protein
VVATEVGELARQSATSAAAIRELLQRIRVESDRTTSAVGEMTELVNQIDGLRSVVRDAIVEQGAATEAVSRAMQQQIARASEISDRATALTS